MSNDAQGSRKDRAFALYPQSRPRTERDVIEPTCTHRHVIQPIADASLARLEGTHVDMDPALLPYRGVVWRAYRKAGRLDALEAFCGTST